MKNQPTTHEVKRIRDAHGAFCADCDAIFNVTTCPYWSWTKSVWMHRNGSGHDVRLYAITSR